MKLALLLLFLNISAVISQTDNNPIARWDKTDKLIWDNKIEIDAAVDSIAIYVPLAVDYCKIIDMPFTKRDEWVFPMAGYTKTSYRSDGKDYKDEKFDYFQGGNSHGHPAHDIFILDSDSNIVEDATGKKVDASAMVSGVIINIKNNWIPSDMGRGGNFVKLFDPVSKAIFYYSHLDSVTVSPGQIVRAGEKIGVVGRTGRKAFRGKTHLHIAYYKIVNGYPKPVDILQNLYNAQKREELRIKN
jgi:hypothetical protein